MSVCKVINKESHLKCETVRTCFWDYHILNFTRRLTKDIALPSEEQMKTTSTDCTGDGGRQCLALLGAWISHGDSVECSATAQALQKAADAELMCVWGWRVLMSTINKCMNPYKSSHIKVS